MIAREPPKPPAGPRCRFGYLALLASEAFSDGQALLRVAEKHELEGVASKRRDAPYRSGACRRWRNVKTDAWRNGDLSAKGEK